MFRHPPGWGISSSYPASSFLPIPADKEDNLPVWKRVPKAPADTSHPDRSTLWGKRKTLLFLFQKWLIIPSIWSLPITRVSTWITNRGVDEPAFPDTQVWVVKKRIESFILEVNSLKWRKEYQKEFSKERVCDERKRVYFLHLDFLVIHKEMIWTWLDWRTCHFVITNEFIQHILIRTIRGVTRLVNMLDWVSNIKYSVSLLKSLLELKLDGWNHLQFRRVLWKRRFEDFDRDGWFLFSFLQ